MQQKTINCSHYFFVMKEMTDQIQQKKALHICQMWRVSDFSTSVMWRNLTFLTWQMWRIFRFFHICYVWESNISPHDKFFSTYLICEICDKYEVCTRCLALRPRDGKSGIRYSLFQIDEWVKNEEYETKKKKMGIRQ